MKIITITVTGDRCPIPSSDRSAGSAGSYNNIKLSFVFDTAWTGLSRKVSFQNNPKEPPVDVILDLEDACLIPAETLKYKGTIYFSIAGTIYHDDGSYEEKIKTQSEWMTVSESIADGSNTPAPISPDTIAQLTQYMLDAQDLSAGVVSGEGVRVTNEGARIVAESVRVGAESGRVTAESARVISEGSRVSDENARAQALASIIQYTTVPAVANIYAINLDNQAFKNVKMITSDAAAKTVIVSNVPAQCELFIELTYTNAAAITWFAGVTWLSGSAPALTAGKVYRMSFYTSNAGAVWHGTSVGGW